MIKLPARDNGQWTVTHNSDKLPDLAATRNLTFDKEGYLRLSKPLTSFYSEADDADFGLPILFTRNGNDKDILTTKAQFELFISSGLYNCAESTRVNSPVTSSSTWESDSHAVYFQRDLHWAGRDATVSNVITSTSGLYNDWTNNVTTGLNTNSHPMESFTSQSTLAVGDGNIVRQYSTAYAEVTSKRLTISSDYNVTGLAYNNGLLGITTHDRENAGNGMFYVWDGNTTAANYAYRIGASTCTSPKAYKGTFVFLTGDGRLMMWTPSELVELASLPVYYNGGTFFVGDTGTNRNESIFTEGDVLYINIDSYYTTPTADNEHFIPEQAGGVWCYDPAVGLYHRHATTTVKSTAEVILMSAVDTATDEITVTSAPETGTPAKYTPRSSTVINGLTEGVVYYVIKVDSTTIKLATTYSNALAETAIDLTSTGNDLQTLKFFPKTDFGQSKVGNQQGCVNLMETDSYDLSSGLFYGAELKNASMTTVNTAGFSLRDTENRGYFITAKMYSEGLQDHWQKLYVKHKALSTDLDKLVIKYRTDSDLKIVKSTDFDDAGAITWTDSSTFTTTDTQFANVLVGDEVEVVMGAGSGYLAHVTAISEDSGTYTVTIDEEIKNLTAGNSGLVVVSRWTKLSTITKDTVRNDDGYSEITVGKKSKMIQFKVELRGEDVEIEELLISNTLSKPV